MKSGKSFIEFIKTEGGRRLLLIALCALILLAVAPNLGGSEKGQVSEEERLAELCSMTDGVGECRVMISSDGDGRVVAVALLCEGAESAAVRGRLTSLICSLYGIGSHRVAILKLGGSGE